MRVRFGQELYTARLVHSLKFLENLRCVHLKLLNTCTRKAECNLEELAVLVNHIVQGIECRHIAALGDIGDATLILVVVVVIMIGTDIEETITLQMDNLMYLEI